MCEAVGKQWHMRDRKRGVLPDGLRNVDVESGWGCSRYQGWVQGYAWHVVCSAPANHLTIPLLAEVEPNNVQENRVFVRMIAQIPRARRRVLADEGYDDNELIRQVEQKVGSGFGRRMLLPMKVYKYTPDGRREYALWFKSEAGQKLFRRRKTTIERWFGRLKDLFDYKRCWMKGLKNNRALMLLILLAYQLLIYYNWNRGAKLARVKEILDGI